MLFYYLYYCVFCFIFFLIVLLQMDSYGSWIAKIVQTILVELFFIAIIIAIVNWGG